MEIKKFWKSKTLIVNVLIIAGAVFTDLANFLGTGETLTLFAAINLLLRVFTSKAISLNTDDTGHY